MPAGLDSPTIDVTRALRQQGALATETVESFATIRQIAGSTDAAFSFGSRSLRPGSGAQGDRFFATDRQTLYVYNGTAWEVVVGFDSGSDATRAAITPDTTDNGMFFFTTDTGKLWEVAGGAWVDRNVDISVTTGFKVGTNYVVKARKTGWSVATGTATRTSFDTTTVTLPQLAEAVKALIDDLHQTAGHGLIGT